MSQLVEVDPVLARLRDVSPAPPITDRLDRPERDPERLGQRWTSTRPIMKDHEHIGCRQHGVVHSPVCVPVEGVVPGRVVSEMPHVDTSGRASDSMANLHPVWPRTDPRFSDEHMDPLRSPVNVQLPISARQAERPQQALVAFPHQGSLIEFLCLSTFRSHAMIITGQCY